MTIGSAEARRPPRAPRRAWAPPLLLLVMAGCQMTAACHWHLLPWKGGGFGMFAAIDGTGLRAIRAWDDDGRRLALPSTVFAQERRALEWPTASRLDALARALAEEERPAARLEVWRVVFDEELQPDWRRLARRAHEAPQP